MSRGRKKKSGIVGILSAFVPVAFLLVGIAWYFTSNSISENATDNSIEYIASHTNSAGNLVDYTGDIGVKSIDDIRLYITENQVKIKYGKIDLTFTPDGFMADKYTIPLERIGITRQINKKTQLIEVFYHGVLLERWAS